MAFVTGLNTVAVHPTENQIAVGGEMNFIAILDASDFSTVSKIKVDAYISDLQFDQDGSHLVALTDDNDVHYIEVASGTVVESLSSVFNVAFSQELGLMAAYHWFDGTVVVYDLNTFRKKGSVGTSESIEAIGFDPVDQHLIIATDEVDYMEEEYVDEDDFPDFPDFASEHIYEQQHDQKGSKLVCFDVNTMEEMHRFTIPYYILDSFGCVVSGNEHGIFLIGWEQLLKVDREGNAELFDRSLAFSYGAGYTSDRRYMLCGSTLDGFVFDTETNELVEYEAELSMDFFGGYTHDYEGSADAIYAVRSDWAIYKLNASGDILAEAFVDFEFQLYMEYEEDIEAANDYIIANLNPDFVAPDLDEVDEAVLAVGYTLEEAVKIAETMYDELDAEPDYRPTDLE